MKHCQSCGHGYASSMPECDLCGFQPQVEGGYTAYAPQFAYEGKGFKPEYFDELARLESGNFWFISRSRLITWMLRKYCQPFDSFLEIGCGTGYVLASIEEASQGVSLSGSELFLEGLQIASARVPSAELMQMDARNIPFLSEFSVIGAFDVLEHIDDDECVLAEIYKALEPGGNLILTVPQHPWLWSAADEHACHERRYTATDLHRKIERANFRIVRSTSFVSVLLPLMFLSRLLKGKEVKKNYDPASEFRISSWMNTLLTSLLAVEAWVVRMGINFSAGGSRIVVAQKPYG